ncbi:hypothetical protein DFA_10117 [Cavenderia fasciculata]|uniref:Uncharacterized protein n=1 Tax=Cavenderia fasciculata TaxID=261658 RepID=F4Q9B4_CACFS|nr:uncharacterized protein DFA_10117 [Cavenderia fasciculata]EGG15283.1 hypothetical protein DFA_10117 [Cavenderia fasciculata]|eukprot:XP_004352003.1 hypothetical protein DFA_10117 [Cavenderia fasciculata]
MDGPCNPKPYRVVSVCLDGQLIKDSTEQLPVGGVSANPAMQIVMGSVFHQQTLSCMISLNRTQRDTDQQSNKQSDKNKRDQ